MRPPHEPATALRSALASPWPELQTAARNVIRSALEAPTLAESASILRIGRRTLERIRADFPEVFRGTEHASENRQRKHTEG